MAWHGGPSSILLEDVPRVPLDAALAGDPRFRLVDGIGRLPIDGPAQHDEGIEVTECGVADGGCCAAVRPDGDELIAKDGSEVVAEPRPRDPGRSRKAFDVDHSDGSLRRTSNSV